MNSPEKEHFLKIYRDMLEFKDGFDNGVGREYAEYCAYIEHEQEEYELGNRQGWENMQTFSEFFLERIRPIYKKIDDWLSVLSATQQKEEVIALRTQINYYIGLSEKYTLTKQVSTGKRYERYFIYFKANLPNIIWVVVFGKKLKNVKFLPFEGFLHGSLFLYQIKVISCICHEVPKEINGIKKQTTITALLNKEYPVIKKSLELISERLAKYLYEELPVLGADSSSSNNEELITTTETVVLMPDTNQETNRFNGMPIKDVRAHFSKLTTNRSKKGNIPHLTEAQFEEFISSAFLNPQNSPQQKISINFANGEKGAIRYLFYQFYDLSKNECESTHRVKDKYVRLLTDNFRGFSYKSIFDNFNKK